MERPVTEIAAVSNGAVTWGANRAGIYLFFNESEDLYEVKFYDFAARQIKPDKIKVRFPAKELHSPSVSADGQRFLSITDNVSGSNIVFASLKQ